MKNNTFQPDHLKVEKGSIIEWKVQESNMSENDTSLYKMESRSYVIAFKNIPVESPVLKNNETFKVRVKESKSH